MSVIFSTQDFFTIKLSTVDDFGNDTIPVGVSISSFKIAAKSPKGIITEWNASFNAGTKEIVYNSEDDVFLTPAGKWTFWSVLYTDDGRRIPGTPVCFDVHKEGDNCNY